MLNKYKYLCHKIIFITALSAGIFVLFSQSLFSEKDSVVKKFPDIEVEDSRIYSGSSFRFSSNEKITRNEIQQYSYNRFSDILNRLPGVFIRDYGGFGGIKTISSRGTSAGQSLIMINGIRLNSSQNSVADLSKIPVSMIESIEVMRGGNSAVFGGNAVGSIININTGNLAEIVSASAEAGSYEYRNINFAYSPKKTPISVNIDYISSEGDYKFSNKNSDNDLLERKNAEFERLSTSIFYKKNNFRISTFGNFSKRGVPGGVLKGNPQSENAKFDEYELYFNAGFTHEFNNSFLDYSLNHKSSYSEYYANGSDSYVINDEHIFNLNETSVVIDYNYQRDNSELVLKSELTNSILAGNMLQPYSDELVLRRSISISSVYYSDNFFNTNVNTQFGLRYDYFSDAGSALSPVFGINYDRNKLNLNFQYSYNFRVPSFNEMYYINYGNSELEPERSHSFNLGSEYELMNNLELSGSLFFINTTNKIISIPLSPVSWTADNIGKVENKGLELKLKYYFRKFLSFYAAYTLQNAMDKTDNSLTFNKILPYTPQEIISSNITGKFRGFMIAFNLQYNSFSYSLPDNDYNSVIDNHFLFDIHFSKSLKINRNKFKIFFKITNLSDESFEIIKNYPMPGRQYFLGFKYAY